MRATALEAQGANIVVYYISEVAADSPLQCEYLTMPMITSTGRLPITNSQSIRDGPKEIRPHPTTSIIPIVFRIYDSSSEQSHHGIQPVAKALAAVAHLKKTQLR